MLATGRTIDEMSIRNSFDAQSQDPYKGRWSMGNVRIFATLHQYTSRRTCSEKLSYIQSPGPGGGLTNLA